MLLLWLFPLKMLGGHRSFLHMLQVDGRDLIITHLLDPFLPFMTVVKVGDVLPLLSISHLRRRQSMQKPYFGPLACAQMAMAFRHPGV